MTILKSIALCLPCSLIAVPAFAAPGDSADDQQVIVTAGRAPQPLDRVGQSVSVLDEKTIDTRQTQAIADLLRTTPGLTIARNGGLGQPTSAFIRGAESGQTVAVIDGVKITDPALPNGGFDFANLLTGNIDRIEVVRGPSSVIWGSQAIGGVVNVITRAPTDTLAINARAEGGYRGTAQVVGNVSDTVGPLAFSVGGGYLRTDGISAFDEARGGRERDGYRNVGANLKLNLKLSEAVSIDLRSWYSDGRAGQDGFPPPFFNFSDTREYGTTRQVVGYGGVNVALFGGRFRNRFSYEITDTARGNFDPDGFLFETFRGNGRNERVEYQGIADLPRGLQATFGFEREVSRYATISFGGPETRGRALLTSGYAQLSLTPVKGLTIAGGVRHDEHDRFGGQTSTAASAVYSPNHGATTLRASYSEGFKVPSLFQLQSEFGNQTLRPERARGWDAGVTQRALDGKLEVSATYFHRISSDLIDFVSCPTPLVGICVDRPFGTFDNVARAVTQGVELGLVLRPIEPLSFTANYSWIDARNRAAGSGNFGRQLVRRPDQTVNLTLDYRWPFKLTTGTTVSHVGASFDDTANTRRIGTYTLTDLHASLPVFGRFEIYGRIENLFDERYETIPQFGTAGRAGYGGVRVRF